MYVYHDQYTQKTIYYKLNIQQIFLESVEYIDRELEARLTLTILNHLCITCCIGDENILFNIIAKRLKENA